MTRGERGRLAREIVTLYDSGVAGGLDDDVLLERFTAGGEPAASAAFTVLISRHGPMVLRICRTAIGNHHDAEEAFQATFLTLALQAGAIRQRGSVASWLFGVARRVSQRARSDTARRTERERRVARTELVELDESDGGWEELHEEVDRLPQKYRRAVVLCYLEGLTQEQAASQLDWPVGTVKVRLMRARALLRRRLLRRGFAPVGALAVPTIPPRSVAATLAEATLASARAAIGGGVLAGAVPVAVGLLTKGVLNAMKWDRRKRMVEWGLAVAVVAIGVGSATRVGAGREDAQPGAQTAGRPAAAAPAAEVEAEALEGQSPERLLLRSREAIEKLPAGWEKARLLSELATAQAEVGDHKAARETGHRAVAIAEAITEEQPRVNELREAAKALGAAGDIDGALAAEEKIGTGSPIARSYREFVLQEVGEALVRSGFRDEARRVMNIMQRKRLKTEVLAWALTSAEAKAGNVNAALQTAGSIPDGAFRVAALVGVSFDASTYYEEFDGGIALAQFRSGDRAGAEETLRKAQAIADTLTDLKRKGLALSLIARATLKMGDLPGATREADEIADDEGRDRVRVDIATVHANAGRWDDAMKTVESIQGDAPRLVALNRVGVARAKAKNRAAARALFAQALAISRDLKLNGQPDPTGPYHVARAQAESGDFRAAKETLRRSRPNSPADEVAEFIAMTQATTGAFERALLTLELLSPSSTSTRSRLLGEIVRLQVESGDERQWIDWDDELDSPVSQARVLIGLARGLAARKHARSR